MSKVIYNKNTRTSSEISGMFEPGYQLGEIVLDNNSNAPGLWMTKLLGGTPTPFKLNDIKNMVMDSALDNTATGDVAAGDTVFNALSKVANGAENRKFTKVNTLSNLTFNTFLTIATINTDTTLTISTDSLVSVPNGCVREGHLLINNTGASNIAITIGSDSRVRTTNGTTFSVEAGGIGELNALVINDNGTYTIYIITS